MKNVQIFTDGSCLGNPGPGGFGVIIKYNNAVKELSGGSPHTTNNAMELLGAINGLACLKEPCIVDLTTDSEYVKKGVEQWIRTWKMKNWTTSSNTPVKNKELWMKLDEQLHRHQVRLHWVKGHNGHPENERCDELARTEASKHQPLNKLERELY